MNFINNGGLLINKRNSFVLLFAGLVGLFASIKLIIEKVAVLSDSSYVPSCDINPILSCGSVINTQQAAFFGFPNPIIGIVSFTTVVTLAVLMVFKVQLPPFAHLGLLAGSILGFVFVCYLIYQSLYTISALCPWCMVVWASLFIILWQTITYNITEVTLPFFKTLAPVVKALDWLILAALFVTVIGLIFINWLDFWLSI
jgi:uncharacterized membrane protein